MKQNIGCSLIGIGLQYVLHTYPTKVPPGIYLLFPFCYLAIKLFQMVIKCLLFLIQPQSLPVEVSVMFNNECVSIFVNILVVSYF